MHAGACSYLQSFSQRGELEADGWQALYTVSSVSQRSVAVWGCASFLLRAEASLKLRNVWKNSGGVEAEAETDTRERA